MFTDKIPKLRELTDDDVLLGRGFPAIENEGNVRFRELVRSRSAEYHAAYRRHTKDSIARDVVNTIHRRKGRFLTQLDNVPNIKGLVIPAGARVWIEADEAAVLIKAKQALRDHSDDSKEGRPYARRRAAAGSGNVVLKWVSPSSSSEQAGVPGSAHTTSTASANAAAGAMPSPSLGGSSLPQPQLSSLLSAQPLSFFNHESGGLGSMTLPGLQGGARSEDPSVAARLAAAAAAAAASQQQNLFVPGQVNAHAAIPPSPLQAALQQLLENQGRNSFARDANSVPGGIAGILQSTTDASLNSLYRRFGTQLSGVTVSDQGLTSSQHLSSSSSNSLTSNQQLSRGSSGSNQAGSRASMAISKGIEKAKSTGSIQEEEDLPLSTLEVSLLRVICSFGLPLWSKNTRESALATTTLTREEGSLALTWIDIGKHFLLACGETADAVLGTAAATLSTDPRSLARIAVFLVGRCLDCTKATTPTAEAASRTRAGGTIGLTKGDSAIVEHALTQWSLELGDCSALDGSRIVGTMLETLNAPAEALSTEEESSERMRASPRSVPPAAAAVMSGAESKTIVETVATQLQLRWIFQHPTATIFSLLSAQGGDTSRDFLLLKGVLEHGLVNELDFRIQGSSMTRNEVEDRICLLTKLLFKHLQDLQKKDAVSSLKRKYTALMGGA